VSFISWRKIRGLGELQILTKASYIMIIVVPVLVAFWPGVQRTVSFYNDTVAGTKVKIENSVSKTDAGSVTKDTVSESPKFPCILAWSFFAFLFVIFAHSIYGMCVPSIVRKHSIIDYAALKKEEYSKYPSEGMLRTASFYCERASENPNIKLTYGEYTNMENNDEDDFKKNLDFINTGAYAQYLLADYRYLPARIITALLYLFGLTLLLAIIAKQSVDIVSASGWL